MRESEPPELAAGHRSRLSPGRNNRHRLVRSPWNLVGRMSLRMKLFLILACLSILVTWVAIYIFYLQAHVRLANAFRSELLTTVAAGALAIDGDLHSRLRSPADQDGPVYNQVKARLNQIKAVNPNVHNIYTMRKAGKPNIWQFVVDTQETGDIDGDGIIEPAEKAAGLGEEYDVSPYPEMQKAFDGPSIDREVSSDKWGAWLSAYAPIRDSSGRAVAILGIDMSAADVLAESADAKKKALTSHLAAIVMALIGSFAISTAVSKPMVRLTKALRRLDRGDYGYRIDCDRDDEIGKVSRAFNVMSERLQRKLEELHHLVAISQEVVGMRDTESLLDRVLKSGVELVEGTGGLVVLYDPERERLEPKASMGLDPESTERIRERLEELQLDKSPIAAKTTAAPCGFLEFPASPPASSAASERPASASEGSRASSPRLRTTTIRQSKAPSSHGGCTALYVPLKLATKLVGVMCIVVPDARRASARLDAVSELGVLLTMAIENVRLYGWLAKSYVDTVKALVEAMEAKDPYTRGHSEKVARYAVEIGRKLGLDESGIQKLRWGGILHDIGKISIPDSILAKPGALDSAERQLVNSHPRESVQIAGSVQFLLNVLEALEHHHERYDGKGYPSGLSGRDIPLAARIMAVADAFDAMTSARPYREAMSVKKAMSELRKNSGTQFDPELVEIWESVVREGHIQFGAAGQAEETADLSKDLIDITSSDGLKPTPEPPPGAEPTVA